MVTLEGQIFKDLHDMRASRMSLVSVRLLASRGQPTPTVASNHVIAREEKISSLCSLILFSSLLQMVEVIIITRFWQLMLNRVDYDQNPYNTASCLRHALPGGCTESLQISVGEFLPEKAAT